MKVLAKFLVGIVLAVVTSIPCSAQESATFSMRGVTALFSFNHEIQKYQAFIHTNLENFGYIVVCPDSFSACPAAFSSALLQCTNVTGTIIPIQTIGSHTDESFIAGVIGFPANCSIVKATFLITGHITGYIPAAYSDSGYPEFDIEANGLTYHSVCDPMYSSCESAIYSAVLGNKCVTATGDIESTALGFIGDTIAINWTTFLYVSGGNSC